MTIYTLNQKYHKNQKNMIKIKKIRFKFKKSDFFDFFLKIMIFINLGLNQHELSLQQWLKITSWRTQPCVATSPVVLH